MLCDDPSALRQALRDLQREVISINGQVLPHVTSRKQLLQQLQQALNSKPTLKKNRKGPTKKTASKELDLNLSSEYDGSTDDSTTHNNNNKTAFGHFFFDNKSMCKAFRKKEKTKQK